MKLLVYSFVISLFLQAGTARGEAWPHLRGPAFDGRIPATGTFDADSVGLDLAWRVPLGSAYSGVAVADGRAVTTFSDGASDWVAAFDVENGKQVWRRKLGPVTKGLDGADDGPLSTPVIGGGTVYALAPAGRLVALRLGDGASVWSRELKDGLEAKAPYFGFTTTPLLEGKLLVVQAGGKQGGMIVGLDARTGEKLWSHGDDAVDYQSPAAMTLAGTRQIVAVSKTRISGLAADGGDVLWTHELGEEERSSTTIPTFIEDDRFLIIARGGARVFRVSRSESGFSVDQLYVSDVLGETYAQPVYREGHVYGFRGQVLSCMNATNGERVWRSRPPGGDGLILVDDHLVIFGAKGHVVVARATPEGYQERARVQAFDGSGLTWPSFAAGRIFVRNLEQLAAVAVTRAETEARVAPSEKGDHAFGRWVQRVEAADDRAALVDELMQRHEGLPIVEGEYVHFVFRGEATDVAIAGSMNDTDGAEPMHPIDGTDLFHRSYRLEPGGRWEYRYQIDFETWTPDPNNPRSVLLVEGEGRNSELITPGYDAAAHTAEPVGPRGKLDSFTLSSQILGYDKEIQVWLPPGYEGASRAFPLLVVNDGTAWLEKGLMANTLDNLVGKSVAPVVVAFVPAYGRWWLEAGGTRTDDYVRMQVEELIPALEERYRLLAEPTSRGVMGNRFYGTSSAYAALRHPDVFGKVSVQSVYLGLGAEVELWEMLKRAAGPSTRVYLDWNRYDERNIDRDIDFAADSRVLAERLKGGGYTTVGGEVLDSYGWGGWRNRTDRVLIALFPAP